jgi:hypothetical protein
VFLSDIARRSFLALGKAAESGVKLVITYQYLAVMAIWVYNQYPGESRSFYFFWLPAHIPQNVNGVGPAICYLLLSEFK